MTLKLELDYIKSGNDVKAVWMKETNVGGKKKYNVSSSLWSISIWAGLEQLMTGLIDFWLTDAL